MAEKKSTKAWLFSGFEVDADAGGAAELEAGTDDDSPLELAVKKTCQ